MNTTVLRRTMAAGLALGLLLIGASALPAQAALNLKKPGASADAYGVLVDARLLAGNVPVDVGPLAPASQDYPPGADTPATADILQAGPIPGGGELVQNVGVISSMAGANAQPEAVASSQAANVELLSQAGVPLITADLVRAQSNSNCVDDPNATGTEFVNLRVAGNVLPINPPPNTEIDILPVPGLNVLRIVLNEQHPTADGRGLVVNAIHIYSTTTGDALFRGDLIIAHAMSTVSCPNGKGSTGDPDSDIYMTKDVTPVQGKAGDTVTYNASIKNNSDQPCLVNKFIEHLPQAFELVSTSGALGDEAEVVARQGGGEDVVIKPDDVTIAAGATATQKFVLKVKSDAEPGVYFNNLELFCANLGNWAKGLDAPFQVNGPDPQASPTPRKPQCSDGIDNDGDGKIDFPNDPGCDSPADDDERDRPATMPKTGDTRSLQVLAGLGLLAAAWGIRKVRTTVA